MSAQSDKQAPSGGITLGELAARFGCQLSGEPQVRVHSVATLANAQSGQLSFLANKQYRRFLAQTQASAVIVHPDQLADCPGNALLADDPYVLYARIAHVLHPAPAMTPGVAEGAHVSPDAALGADVRVEPGAVIEAGVQLGARVWIGPGCVVQRDCRIGDDTRLVANVTLCHGVRIGARGLIHPNTVVGSDGFGLARAPEGWIKVAQVGAVQIGDDVEIGAGTTVDRGAIEDTEIGNGVKLDNQIQVAHNVRIGEHTVVAACTGVSGSTTIGKRCMIAGAVGFVGHLDIADDVVITGQTMVNKSITKPGVYSSALPMDEASRWRRNSARFRKLDELAKRVKQLERVSESSAGAVKDLEGRD